jgi:hypothetical protein
MNSKAIVAELTNLANGCVAHGDLLGAQICANAIAEIERLTKANWYWDDRDLESAVPPDEVGAFDDVGDIIKLRPIHELPAVYALITEDGPQFFDSEEEAEVVRES